MWRISEAQMSALDAWIDERGGIDNQSEPPGMIRPHFVIQGLVELGILVPGEVIAKLNQEIEDLKLDRKPYDEEPMTLEEYKDKHKSRAFINGTLGFVMLCFGVMFTWGEYNDRPIPIGIVIMCYVFFALYAVLMIWHIRDYHTTKALLAAGDGVDTRRARC